MLLVAAMLLFTEAMLLFMMETLDLMEAVLTSIAFMEAVLTYVHTDI